MLRLKGRYGNCFVDPESIVAIEAHDIWIRRLHGGELEFSGVRIVFKGGGDVLVFGDVDAVTINIVKGKDS